MRVGVPTPSCRVGATPQRLKSTAWSRPGTSPLLPIRFRRKAALSPSSQLPSAVAR
ncbi:Uncharacterised protein [Bordetella pertussis]|nr:Uncharacterised protein [Bordetella pertussis]